MFVFAVIGVGVAFGATYTSMRDWTFMPVCGMAFLMLCGAAIDAGDNKRLKYIFGAAILCLAAGCLPAVTGMENSRPDWQQAVAVFSEDTGKDTPVIFIDGKVSPPAYYHASGYKERFVSLYQNFDLETLKGSKGFRQTRVTRLLDATIDSRPPFGLAEIIANNDGQAWIVEVIDDSYRTPRHTHEYRTWLKKYAAIEKRVEIGGGVNLTLVRVYDKR